MPLKMFSGCLWLFNYRIGNLQTVCVAELYALFVSLLFCRAMLFRLPVLFG